MEASSCEDDEASSVAFAWGVDVCCANFSRSKSRLVEEAGCQFSSSGCNPPCWCLPNGLKKDPHVMATPAKRGDDAIGGCGAVADEAMVVAFFAGVEEGTEAAVADGCASRALVVLAGAAGGALSFLFVVAFLELVLRCCFCCFCCFCRADSQPEPPPMMLLLVPGGLLDRREDEQRFDLPSCCCANNNNS